MNYLVICIIVFHLIKNVNKTSILHAILRKNKIYLNLLKYYKDINKIYMANTYQIFLISDSTGETLDRIFLVNSDDNSPDLSETLQLFCIEQFL